MFAYVSIVITYVITIAECRECRVGRVQSVGESGWSQPRLQPLTNCYNN